MLEEHRYVYSNHIAKMEVIWRHQFNLCPLNCHDSTFAAPTAGFKFLRSNTDEIKV